MGQRLCITIYNHENPLAAAYYHWSAYTSSSACMLHDIMTSEYLGEAHQIPPLERAVRLLLATGAGIDDSGVDTELKACRVLGLPEDVIVPCSDRTEGLISVTKEGIEECQDAAEFLMSVDIGKKTVDFGVLMEYTSLQDWFDEWELDAEDEDDAETMDYRLKAYNEPDNILPFYPGDMTYDEALAFVLIVFQSLSGRDLTESTQRELEHIRARLSDKGMDALTKIHGDELLRGPDGEALVFIE